jgi:rod shape-determining protein MreC
MNNKSVGLEFTTRQMSVASCQDRKIGRKLSVYLSLSVLILLVNSFASASIDRLKHHFVDQTIFITEALHTPVNAAKTFMAEMNVILDVHESNQRLAEENKRLLEWYQAANRLESENRELRDLLNMKDETALQFQSAKVIMDAETQYARTILVKIGENDNVQKGQGVLNHEGLIGRVIETGEQTSRVLLLSDVNSRIPVMIEGSRDRAILAGTNNSDPVLNHLPEGHGVGTGQRVVTSGHGGIFPYGIPVGETYQLDNGYIAVRPFADSNRSAHVQVVEYGIPAGSAHRNIASAGSGVLR